MRGNLTLCILKAVCEMSVEGVELCEAIITAGYGASDFRIRRIQEQKKEKRLRNSAEVTQTEGYIRNYQKLISKLKKQGLLEVENREGTKFLGITTKGKSKLSTLESQFKQHISARSFVSSPSERPVIVSFDIPEKQRRKRDWVREVLKSLGLKMVQQSVWVGMVKIPKPFLDDLEEQNLLNCVEIFEVGKSGTLKRIV